VDTGGSTPSRSLSDDLIFPLASHKEPVGAAHSPSQAFYQHLLRADDGIRTRDPHLGKVMLYQLSHVRVVQTD
jgi:hypothetical protein